MKTTREEMTKWPWRVGDAGLTVFGPPNGNPAPETVANCRKRADAKAIGALPELIEALSWITRCAKMSGPGGTTAYFIGDKYMEAAKEALRKAGAL